jgi:hypothetical protein
MNKMGAAQCGEGEHKKYRCLGRGGEGRSIFER